MSEGSEVVGPLMQALTEACIYNDRYQSGEVKVRGGYMMLHKAGTGDVGGFLDGGRAFWIEAKVRKGKLRESQIKWAEMVRARGVLYLVCHDRAQVVPTVQALLLAQGQRWCG